MMAINVTADVNRVLNRLTHLKREAVPKAASRALNKTLTSVRAEAARQVKQSLGYGIKIAVIKKYLKKQLARARDLQAALRARSHAMPIIKLDPLANQTTGGVTYRLGAQLKTLPHAFLAHMKNGHRGVYRRQGRARLPIQEEYAVIFLDLFRQEAIQKALLNVAQTRWPITFRQELNFLLRQGH